MSYLHYKIPFKSLRTGIVYTVEVWKDAAPPSGYPLTLKGGAEPFVIQEDDDDDMFAPVRTQTGHLRIVDDGYAADGVTPFNWKNLIPATDTDTLVVLTDDSDNIYWRGFMQSQNFSSSLFENPQEREFPVQCPLSVLSSADVDTSERKLRNFGYVIAKAFGSIPIIDIDSFVFQGGADARSWLLKMVDWQNYVTSEDGDTLTARYDYGLIIEDICKYWGWSCRWCVDTVYFSRVDDGNTTQALVLCLSDLEDLTESSGKVSGAYLTTSAITGAMLVSTDNDETLVRGRRKATVKADAGDGDTTIVEAFPRVILDKIEAGGTSYTETYGDATANYYGKLTSLSSAFLDFQARSGYGSFDYLTGTVKGEEDASLSGSAIRILKSFVSESEQAFVSIQTKFEHSYGDPDGKSSRVLAFKPGLQLKGKIVSAGEEFKIEDFRQARPMWMRLGIGATRATAKWYNGWTWSDTVTAFRVIIGYDDNIFEVVHSEGSGAIIHSPLIVTDNLTGILFIEFLGSNVMPEVDGARKFDILDFEVGVYYKSDNNKLTRAEEDRNDEYEYTASSQGNARNDWNSDLAYASANNYMSYGYGVVINEDGSRMTTVPYGSGNEIPEQNMANRVAAYWGTSKRQIRVELDTAQLPTPSPRVAYTVDGGTFYPISISHEWRDDKTILTLLEL